MGDDRKKSWKEIDAARDKSRHGSRDARKPSAKEEQASAHYKKDLDALFKPGGDVPERFKGLVDKLQPEEGSEEAVWREAVNELRATEGFREFTMAARSFRRVGHRLPDDEDLIVRLLDVPDEGTLLMALQHVLDMERRGGFARKTPIKNRMQTMRSLAEERRTLQLLDEIEAIL